MADPSPLKLKNPISATNFSESVKEMTIPSRHDEDGVKVPASPVFIVDPSANPVLADGAVGIHGTQAGQTTGINYKAAMVRSDGGAISPSPDLALLVASQLLLTTGAGDFRAQRTPNVFKNALITAAGSTAIWTAGVGVRWRLMGLRITLVNGTTAAAASLLKMLDVAADMGIGVQICGAAMGAVPQSTIIVNETYQNGILAAATNTALNVNLSSVLAVAGVHVQVWGTEE